MAKNPKEVMTKLPKMKIKSPKEPEGQLNKNLKEYNKKAYKNEIKGKKDLF
jgi:hypothetical protein